jgi:hypothetical protein
MATAWVYMSASQICHQQAARSFHTAGHKWPVCARCAGLYLAAPFGAVAALSRGRRRTLVNAVVIAAMPSAATFVWEVMGGQVSGLARAVAAAPLGATLTFALVAVAGRREEAIG